MAERLLKLTLIGKTGCGKSSTGNFILRKDIFKSKRSFVSTTKEITSAEITHDGRTTKVVDTPGLFDTQENVFETALKIQASLNVVPPGPHAFLIVIDASQRYTEEEKKTQHIIQLTFGVKIFKHAIIIFTHEDQFDSSDELLREARHVQELQMLIKLCGERCVTLNSVSKDGNYRKEKLKSIMENVKVVSKNGEVCYTEDITIYTEALKELVRKKTAIKDLTLELVEAVFHKQRERHDQEMKKIKEEADRRVKTAHEEGRSSGFSSGLATGTIVGGALLLGAGACIGGVVVGSAVLKDPEKSLKVAGKILQFGFEIGKQALENKFKSDNQDCSFPNSNDWNWDRDRDRRRDRDRDRDREQERIDMKSLEESLFKSFKRK